MRRALYLAAYDVTDPRRLVKALKVVRRFASGGQKSAYECWLDERERKTLISEMEDVIDPATDSFAVIALNPRRPITAMGVAVEPQDPDYFYFG